MKEVVISTGNPNKFNQISHILTSLNVKADRFVSLSELGITNDESESGTIMDRALQKAKFCLGKVSVDCGCIVGNDVGTRLPTVGIETTESRQLVDEILAGKHLKAGDPINYVYAYAFILLPNQKILTAQAEIPFTYLGNPLGLKRIDGQNTMNQVKAIPGQYISHNLIPPEEVIAYRLKFLRTSLEPIVNEINNLNK